MSEPKESNLTTGRNDLPRLLPVALIAVIPALAAAWMAFRLLALFNSIAGSGAGISALTLSKAVAEIHTLMAGALALTAILALVAGFVQWRQGGWHLSAMQRVLCWAGPLASLLPVYSVWSGSGILRDFLAGTGGLTMGESVTSLSRALQLGQLLGCAVAVGAGVAWVLSRRGGDRRFAPASRSLAFVPMASAAVFAVLAFAFFSRSGSP